MALNEEAAVGTGKGATARKRDRRRILQVGVAGLLTLAVILFAFGGHSPPLQRLSALVFDLYQNIKPRAEAGAPIVVVDIDEASIRELGQWPWPRSEIARMVDRLRELGAAAIAFDVVFSDPDRTSLSTAAEALKRAGAAVTLPSNVLDNDQILANSFVQGGIVAGFVLSNETDEPPPPPKAGFAFAGADPQSFLMDFRGALANLPILNDAAAGLGFFSFPPTPDGIVRVVPLVARSHEKMYPALSVEALRVAQGASSFVIRATGASGEADTGIPAMTAMKVGDFEVPTGPAGEFRIYFSGLAEHGPNLRRRAARPGEIDGPCRPAEREHRAGRHERGRACATMFRPRAPPRSQAWRCMPRSSTRFYPESS